MMLEGLVVPTIPIFDSPRVLLPSLLVPAYQQHDHIAGSNLGTLQPRHFLMSNMGCLYSHVTL